MTKIHPEAVAGLLLDERNPRFAEPAEGQDDALTSILTMAGQKVLSLASDIVEQDAVNPTELPIAVEEDGSLVVIEGNRRLAALKVLRDPQLAKSASDAIGQDLVKRFVALQKQGQGPSVIEVYVADSREAARHWIELRHTGENGGVGVVEWESWQANNYRRRPGSHADKATIFCKAVEIEFPDEAELLVAVGVVRKTRLTTLGRLIGDPEVRRQFGFDFQGDGVVFDYERADLLPEIRQMFADLAGDWTVTKLKTKQNRHDYVGQRAAFLPPREKKLSKPRAAGEGASTAASAGAAGDAKQEPRNKKGREQKPEKVIFEGLRLPDMSPRLRELLKQAQRINIEDSPQVTAILVRVIVELVVTESIMAGLVSGKEGDTLRKKIRSAIKKLDSECENSSKRDKSLEMAWTRSQDPDGMAVQSLHAFVHNPHGAATPIEVRTLSATFRKMLERLDALNAGLA